MKCIMMSCNNCDQEYAFEKVSEILKPNMKVVCVPFASELHWQLNGDFTSYENSHFKVFKNFGIKEENISVVKLSEYRETIINKIESADVVFFSGGFMENFMFIIKSLRLTYFMKDLIKTKIIMGESAGTLVMLDNYAEVSHIEDEYREYKRKTGLGYVNNLDIIVHYDKNNDKHENNFHMLNINNLFTGKDVIALTDNSLIIIDGDEIIMLGDYKS